MLSLSFLSNHLPIVPTALPVLAQSVPSGANVFITNNVTDTAITSGPVTFSVNVSTAPSISSFIVSLQYNHAILQYSSLDPSGNVLAKIATTSILYDCVDGNSLISVNSPCTINDNPGVVTYALYLLHNQTTVSPTNGLLFHVTFNVIGVGLSQLHLLFVELANGGTNHAFSTSTGNLSTRDGYFVNKNCGSTICKPPLVSLSLYPAIFSVGKAGTFNSTVILNNPSPDSIVNYTWTFGEGCSGCQGYVVTTVGTSTHVYQNTGNYTVTVSIIDKYSVIWWTSITAIVTRLFVALSVGSIDVNPEFGSVPGTQVKISATINNRSTIPENGSIQITVERTKTLAIGNYSLPPSGGLHTLSAVWDTTGYSPRAYAIVVIIPVIPNENDTSGNVGYKYVLLISGLGNASLSLGQATGVGILVIVGLGFGLTRFLKKPGYEQEPL